MKMTIATKTGLVWICAALSGVLLLYTSQQVQNNNAELRRVQAHIKQEEQTLRVLDVEWAFLSAPSRLETLAKERLDLTGAEPAIVPSLQVIKRAQEAPYIEPASGTFLKVDERADP